MNAADPALALLGPGPPATLVDLLEARARRHQDDLLYRFLGDRDADVRTMSFGQSRQRAGDVASALRRIARPGQRAILLCPDGASFVSGFFGCQYAGLIAVPACPPFGTRTESEPFRRLFSIVQEAAPRVVLADTSLPTGVRGALLDWLTPRLVGWIDVDLVPASEQPVDPHAPAADDVAYLQYTSGSTSDPKGVMVGHRNVLHNLRLMRDAAQVDQRSSVVSWLPYYHDMGLVSSLLSPLFSGIPATLMSPRDFLVDPLRWLREIGTYGATHAGAPNFAYDLCTRAAEGRTLALDLSSWRVAFNGAEPVRAATLDRFASAFGPYGFQPAAMFTCYGLAEATLCVSGGPPGCLPPRRRPRSGQRVGWCEPPPAGREATPVVSCGVISPELAVVVVDWRTGHPVPEGTEGEVWISGVSVGQGYWNRPEETAGTFGARLPDDDRRYLRSGDLGHIWDGKLYITGRLKDLLIVNGRNVHPADVEASIAACHPDLAGRRCAVFADDAEGEQRMVAVAEVGRHVAGERRQADILQAIRRAIAAQHELRAHAIALVPASGLPVTSSGKVRRAETRGRLRAGQLKVLNPNDLPNWLCGT